MSHDPDQSGSLLPQKLGRRVRLETELSDGLEDGLPGCRAGPGLLTKHERDELTGPAGTARHVAHRGRSRSYGRALSAESVGLTATEARLLSSRRSVDVTA